MSTTGESFDEEKTPGEEDDEKINIGLYIGGRSAAGERNGRGWAILPNGDQYDGQYRKGQRHGIGLYVFKDGSRYYGQYRCGIRSGRGLFIYPDGSYYEGAWRKNLKHGKGRYCYSNGDTYSGDWYRGQRHGVGTYTFKALSSTPNSGSVSFIGTWRQGVRVGPFQLKFGNDDKSATLHGTWDNLFPQGPCALSFNDQYLLTGYFQTPDHEISTSTSTEGVSQAAGNFTEEAAADMEENEEQHLRKDECPRWYAQDICTFDVSLLPQEPVPLPLSDSDISVCSLSTTATKISIEKPITTTAEDEAETGEETNLECYSCECSTSGAESSSQLCPPQADDCAI